MSGYDPEERLEKGKKLIAEQQYHDAIDAFEDAILANYKTDQAYYGLYVAYRALGRDIEAQEALNRSRPSVYRAFGAKQRNCSRCGGIIILHEEYPNRAIGYLILVLGLIFTSFCVGLIIMYYGYNLINDRRAYWHCKTCGSIFPA